MEYDLCKTGCCPKLKIGNRVVEIGEEGNLVKLKAGEWNELVKLVKGGKVGRI